MERKIEVRHVSLEIDADFDRVSPKHSNKPSGDSTTLYIRISELILGR
jgi:hypothetical protein